MSSRSVKNAYHCLRHELSCSPQIHLFLPHSLGLLSYSTSFSWMRLLSLHQLSPVDTELGMLILFSMPSPCCMHTEFHRESSVALQSNSPPGLNQITVAVIFVQLGNFLRDFFLCCRTEKCRVWIMCGSIWGVWMMCISSWRGLATGKPRWLAAVATAASFPPFPWQWGSCKVSFLQVQRSAEFMKFCSCLDP